MGKLPPCRMECSKRLLDEERMKCFKEYWALGDRNKRANYVSSLITINPKKSHKLKSSDIRTCSCTYKLIINNRDINVCKNCFVKTLGETKGFVELVTQKRKLSSSGIITPDRRGAEPPKNKRSDAEINDVKNHIDSFPAYESHYCRASSSKKYLPSDLSISKMYRMYKETRSNPVSMSLYAQCFHEKNFSFKNPKKDTCHKCDVFNFKIKAAESEEDKSRLIFERDIHHHAADKAYSAKKIDKQIAKENPNFKVFTFDLQQCLPTPYLNTSISFYKRQLWSFNLTVHDLRDDSATCFMWDETISGRGGNQIASCLFRHLQSLPSEVEEVTYYSDQCGGQNKNNLVAQMFLYALQNKDCKNIKIINHKFLISGHTAYGV